MGKNENKRRDLYISQLIAKKKASGTRDGKLALGTSTNVGAVFNRVFFLSEVQMKLNRSDNKRN